MIKLFKSDSNSVEASGFLSHQRMSSVLNVQQVLDNDRIIKDAFGTFILLIMVLGEKQSILTD